MNVIRVLIPSLMVLSAPSISQALAPPALVARIQGTSQIQQATALLSAGNAALAAHQYSQAEHAFQQAATLFHQANDPSHEADAYEKLAGAYEQEAAGGPPAKGAPVTPPRLPPAPQQAPVKKPPAGRVPAKTPAAVALPSIGPRAGYVIGRAVFEDGHPIPKFDVSANGFEGAGPVPNGISSLGGTTGSNGVYALPVTDTQTRTRLIRATVVGVQANAVIDYHGHHYQIPLQPTDGLVDGSDTNGFRGDSGKGVVRDFVLSMAGRKPGADEGSQVGYRTAYYGATIEADVTFSKGKYSNLEDATSLSRAFSPSSVAEVTLTPVGALLDGSRGAVVVRKFQLGSTWKEKFLRGIPIGVYQVTATLTPPGGAQRPLVLMLKFGSGWSSQLEVDFPTYSFSVDGSETVALHLGQ